MQRCFALLRGRAHRLLLLGKPLWIPLESPRRAHASQGVDHGPNPPSLTLRHPSDDTTLTAVGPLSLQGSIDSASRSIDDLAAWSGWAIAGMVIVGAFVLIWLWMLMAECASHGRISKDDDDVPKFPLNPSVHIANAEIARQHGVGAGTEQATQRANAFLVRYKYSYTRIQWLVVSPLLCMSGAVALLVASQVAKKECFKWAAKPWCVRRPSFVERWGVTIPALHLPGSASLALPA